MEKQDYPLDLSYLDEVAGGDLDFKKDLSYNFV